MSNTLEFNGKIVLGSEWDSLYIGDENISSEVQDWCNGDIVKLKYYISDKPIEEYKVVENFLKTFYEGVCDADGTYMYGSSWTGCYGKNDELSVGGHDIIAELSEHKGKYCYLVVEMKDD